MGCVIAISIFQLHPLDARLKQKEIGPIIGERAPFPPNPLKVRLRWFGAGLVKLKYLCSLSCDLNVLYIKRNVFFSLLDDINTDAIRFYVQKI